MNASIAELKKNAAGMDEQNREWKRKSLEANQKLESAVAQYHKQQSCLESLKNIAERYDGYGNSIRRVMEQKSRNAGILGVVSDLIQVDKKYETAIETALGGNIQNIVTEDEETAKQMISYLKQNRYGRATFLPLTSVDGKGNFKNTDALKEPGSHRSCQYPREDGGKKYAGVTAYLLGRVIVTENIDYAIKLAKKEPLLVTYCDAGGRIFKPGRFHDRWSI